MRRSVENELLQWRKAVDRKPLLLRGARQIGKTYVVRQFAREYFDSFVEINFELQPVFKSCFDTLDPQQIVNTINAITRKQIIPGQTLLFLDEIQECSKAIQSLRYFRENMADLHVIGAGSLLDFVLNGENLSMPVGRVQSLYMRPLSFQEYLLARGYDQLQQYLSEITLKSGVSEAIHIQLLALLREYMVLGGMPEVLQHYIEHNDLTHVSVIQATLTNAFRNDFGKYDKHVNYKYLQKMYEKVPKLIAEHFKYVKIDPDILSRDLKPALTALVDAGLIYRVLYTAAAGIPLEAMANDRKFKLLFIDVGLVKNALGLDAELLLQKDLMLVNGGALMEQFVGQELIAYAPKYMQHKLYYWETDKPGSSAEIDYIISYDGKIFPLEVKSGVTGRLKSLHLFLNAKSLDFGVRLSQKQLSLDGRVLSIPLYMIHEMPRLLQSVYTPKAKNSFVRGI